MSAMFRRVRHLFMDWTARIRLLIVTLVIVAVAGVLILPQVDMPDAVINPVKISVSGLGHFAVSVSAVRNLVRVAAPAFFSSHFEGFTQSIASHNSTPHLLLIQICAFRC
jgi:hypothetical protein